MNQTQRDKCEAIFKHYGEEKQLVQLQEELGELQSAISRYLNGKNNNMYEEMADVFIMINQFRTSENIVDRIIEDFINEKLNRQLSRIFGDSYSQDKKETKESGWVEFDISKDGIFEVKLNDGSCLYCFWFEVESFLGKSLREKLGFTSFGGYQYNTDEPGVWYMESMLKSSESKLLYHICKCKAEPIIPTKLRFWRES